MNVPGDKHEAMHCIVRGHVQGVGFRYFAQAQAEALGLRGWVSNRADGSVEVVAGGPAEALARFADWLQQGPRHARVKDVTRTLCEHAAWPDFRIR